MRDLEKLSRLAKAQRDIGRLLEAKLVGEQEHLQQLERARTDMMAALDRIVASGLVHYTSAQRRFADLDRNIARSRLALQELQMKLRKAKGSEQALWDRAADVESVELRKRTEEDGQEAALLMDRRATRK